MDASMNETIQSNRTTWFLIAITQSILIIGITIWALTLKVEAEKQKAFATDAIKETKRIQQLLKESQKP